MTGITIVRDTPEQPGATCPRCRVELKAADLLVVRNGSHRDTLADCPICGAKSLVRRDVGYFSDEEAQS